MKKHNFYAGPSILPQYTIDETMAAIKEFAGTGLSLLEVSHRSKEFDVVMAETEALFKELLDVPQEYRVIFVGGGASTQFFTLPYNLLQTRAAYLNTGEWATKAIEEASIFGEVIEVASSKDKNFSYIPRDYTIPTDVDYFHFTSNNTIYGTEIREDFDSPVTLISDMSSDILSRPVDVAKYGLIYGGAQKNLGPAGVTFAILKESILGKVDRRIPTMVDYRTHIKKNSLFNTPPVAAIYSCLMTLRWLKQLGGIATMEKMNIEKSNLLYETIESSKLFRPTIANPQDRSRMNVCFVVKDEYKELEKPFLEFASGRGMVGIKGHRSVGGFRASLYNALPLSSVQALVDCMKEFEAAN